MRIWLPYTRGGSGTDSFTVSFAETARAVGHSAALKPYPRLSQFLPDLLRAVRAPQESQVVLTNAGQGFAFSRPKLPMVTTVHLNVHDPSYASYRSPAQTAYQETLLKRYESRSFDSADDVVAVSEHVATSIAETFDRPKPMVIHNGVDTDFFRPSDGDTGSDRFVLLFVGNLTRRKGSDLLEPTLKILGGDYELRFTSGLRDRGVAPIENGVALGRLNRSELRREYQNADLLLLPTRLEGFSLAAIEAQSCGVPVVGSNLSSMPEAVVDGVTGRLVDNTPVDLATAVRDLAEDDQKRRRMAEAARSRAVTSLDIRQMVDNYIELFKAIA